MLWFVAIFFIIVVWIIIVYRFRHSMVRYHTPKWIRQEQIYMNYSPTHHGVIGIYLNNEENRHKMVELIHSARHEILFSSFCTDLFCNFYKGRDLDSFLLDAHRRGVRIILSLNHYQDNFTEKNGDLDRLIVNRGNIYEIITSKKSGAVLGSNYCNHHVKALCVDQSRLLLGGGIDNSTKVWNEFSSCNVDNVECWTDTAILTYCSPELYKFITKICLYSLNHEHRYINMDGMLEHNNFIYAIRTAQKYVYLENQFIDSGRWTENRIIRELAIKIGESIETGSPFRIMIITNTANTTDDTTTALQSWYVNSCTNRISTDIHSLVTEIYPTATADDINHRLFIGYLKRKQYFIVMHTQFMVVDGIRILKSSSNITDRSLSHSPCDKELGLMFYDPHKVGTFMQKIWNHRLETSNQSYTIHDVFREAQQGGGQYRKIQRGLLDNLYTGVINVIYYLSYFTGPCKKGPYQNTLRGKNKYPELFS